MKKLFLLLFVIVFTVPAFQVKGNTEPMPEPLGIKLVVHVDWGRVSKNCKGFGICDISIDIEYESNRMPGNGSTGHLWLENGRLRLDLDRASISEGTFQTYLSSGVLKVEEDYNLPANVASALGIRSYTIKAGNYSLGQSETEGNNLSLSF